MRIQAAIDLHCVIVKQDGEYCVKSEDKSKNLGCKPSRKSAKKRLRQIEYFKNLKAGGPGSGRHKTTFQLHQDDQNDIKKGYAKLKTVPIANLIGTIDQDLDDVDSKTVAKYAKAMKNGKSFRHITTLDFIHDIPVMDGMHRLAAFKKAFPNEKNIPVVMMTIKGENRANKIGWEYQRRGKKIDGGGPGSGRKKMTDDEKREKKLKVARFDPRQRSLYGPEHEQELRKRATK